MCGIYAYLGRTKTIKDLYPAFMKSQGRGMDSHRLQGIALPMYPVYTRLLLGFHRLSMVDVHPDGDQPLFLGNRVLICNGEIYNYKDLIHKYKLPVLTGSDCEVILHLYVRFGLERTCAMLDGVFGFVLYDGDTRMVYMARDRHGVRPLYYGHALVKDTVREWYVASELKSMLDCDVVQHLEPGTCAQFNVSTSTSVEAPFVRPWYMLSLMGAIEYAEPVSDKVVYDDTLNLLTLAVRKRVTQCERDIALFLSGGFDSSLVAALVVREWVSLGRSPSTLHGFTIGLPGSTDMVYAKWVAEHLGIVHHCLDVTEEECIAAVEDTIYAIESYDITSVRASVMNYLCAKAIRTRCNAKRIFNGDGSDELFGSYLYFADAPSPAAFREENLRLLRDIYLMDALRSERTVASAFSLESCTPFLDKAFVEHVLRLPVRFRMHGRNAPVHQEACTGASLCNEEDAKVDDRSRPTGVASPIGTMMGTPGTDESKHVHDGATKDTTKEDAEDKTANDAIKDRAEKYVLRQAISGTGLLPESVVWRRKEAFSDGCSSTERSWYSVLQDHAATLFSDVDLDAAQETYASHLPPPTKEALWYRSIHERFFGRKMEMITPYYWMPKWQPASVTDPSARVLGVYDSSA